MLCSLDLAVERLVSQVIHNHPRASHEEGPNNEDEKEFQIGPTLGSKKERPKRWEE